MDVLKVCVKEIALSGLEGCTMAELWQHLSSRQPPLSATADDAMKAFIWCQMKETVLKSRSVRVYLLPRPRTPPTNLTESHVLHGLNLIKYKHPFPYRAISREDSVRGSCSSYKERKDITRNILSNNIDLGNLSDIYGDAVVLVASQEIRERVLFREDKTHYRDMSLVQYCILEVVGAARHYGILRNDLTKQFLKIDPRSTFHHCRTLENFGLLKVTGSKRNSIELVHLLLLPSYPLPHWLLEANYPFLVTNMLLKAPNHTLPTSTLSTAFGKGFKSSRSSLIKEGYVESVLLPKPSCAVKTKPAAKAPKVWHLRLLRPFIVTKEEGGEEEEKEEGGGEGEVEEGGGEGEGAPIVFEMPIEMQGYRVIDQSGPGGINNATFCDGGLKVDTLCARQLSKALIKSKNVVTILIDEDGVKKIRLVAARHIEQSKDYEQLLAEHARSTFSEGDLGIRTGGAMFTDPNDRYRDRKRTRRSASVVSSVGGVSDNEEGGAREVKGGSVPVPYCSPGPSGIRHGNETQHSPGSMSELESVVNKSFKKGKQLLTYNMLKRLNVITKFVEDKEIVVGLSDILEHIRQCEKSEGRLQTVDRKTAEKCIGYLVEGKRLCQKTVPVPEIPRHRLPSLIHVPGVSSEKLMSVEEKLILTAREAHIKKETKLEARGRRKRKRKEEDEEEEDEGENEEEQEESDIGDNTAVIPQDAVKLSKYQRLKRLHFYLWILAYGLGETTPTVGSKVTAANGDEEVTSSTPHTLTTSENGTSSTPHTLTTNHPWIAMVMQLPQSGRGPGWLSYNDIIPNMPLSLFTLLMPTLAAGQTVPARYLDYFSLPALAHTPICRLPRRLRRVVQSSERRDISLVNQLLERMVEIGLLQAEGNIQTNKRREQVFVYLERSQTVLDTTACAPRRSFFTKDACSLFKPIVFPLTSLSSCERYWYQLQTICLRTPIVLKEGSRRVKKKKKSSQQATPTTQSSTNDLHPLPYTLRNTHISTKTARDFNKLGFGAGGLPPLAFSHLRRNWYGVTYREKEEEVRGYGDEGSGMGTGECGMGIGNGEEGGMEWSYGPGMGLRAPGTLVGKDEEEGGGGGSEGASAPPTHKRVCLDPKPHPKSGGVVQIPSQQIQRYSGGRGFTRFRSKRALNAARKLKKAKSANSRYSVLAKSAVLVMDGATKKDREMVAVKTHRERVRWLPHEDSFLLLAYLASHALCQVTGGATVSYRQIRDSLHAQYNTSRDKSMDAVQRRVSKLRRRRKALSSTVNVCLAEIISEIQGMGSATPEPTFSSLLSFVTQRYSSHGGLLLGKGSTLPSSLYELTNYDIVGWHSEADSSAVKESVDDDHTLNHALLTDLIIACLGAEESAYDHYAAFRIFETFPEADVQNAFDQLKSRFLIRRRRQTVGGGGPLHCQSFQLATNFNSKLESGYFTGAANTAAEFAGNLAGKRSKVVEVLNKLQQPSDDSTAFIGGDLEWGMEVESGTVGGGIILSLVSTLFAEDRRKIVCEPEMPERLFETDDEQDSAEKRAVRQKQLLEEGAMEGEDEGGGQKLEEDEERRKREEDEGIETGEKTSVREVEGEDEEEEEEEGEKSTSKYSGAGVGSLLRVGDNSVQNHGSLTFDLSLPWSSLLDPLPDELAPPSLARLAEEAPPTLDTPLSLETYLGLCRQHLRMSGEETDFNTVVYRCVEGGGERGREEGEMGGLLPSLPPSSRLSLSDHIQCLLNFEMVFRVSSNLVAAVHSKRWLVPVSCPHSTSPTDLVPFRPWMSVNSAHPNERMMRRYREGVLTFIRASPGASLRKISEHFSGMLHCSALHHILQSLESERSITVHSLKVGQENKRTLRDSTFCLPAL